MREKEDLLVLNRAFAVQSDGKQQIMPLGEYKAELLDGTPIVQVLDHEAAANIVRSIEDLRKGPAWSGILVDLEHRSLDPKGDTTAAAWVTNAEVRPDGVYAPLALTEMGRPLVEGGVYRTLSPVFYLKKIGTASNGLPKMRPMGLHSIGLTNKPNLKGMRPLSVAANAEGWFLSENTTPRTGVPPASAGMDPEEEKQKAEKAGERGRMKEVLKALGLAEDADEAAVLSAIARLKEQAASVPGKDAELAAAKNRVSELETRELEREADAFLAANAERIKDAPSVKKQFVANREATIALFGALAEPKKEEEKTLAANKSAKTPDPDAEAALRLATQQRDAFVSEVMAANKCSTRSQAWAIAQRQKPELFQ